MKWANVHTGEVYFRDTAHGFLAWAVASLLTAALLASAVGAVLGVDLQAGSAAVQGDTAVIDPAARAAAAHSMLWVFVALLCGAFAASVAALFGGRRRDHIG